MNVQLPRYAQELFKPYRYKVLYGGRGSGKSYTIARALLLRGVSSKRRVLCAREFQNSMAESVHKLLAEQVAVLKLQKHYTVTGTGIYGKNGTEFLFKGVRFNVDSIKSMAGITDLWLEEANTISQASWDVLIPTIREPNSEIWVSFNPNDEEEPTYKMFITKEGLPNGRPNSFIEKCNWQDNPWFPDVLATEKDYLYEVNPDLADHVWGGNVRKNSDSQIFRHKWEVREFEPTEAMDGPYHGADWGFSTDPTTGVQVFIDLPNRELLIRHEAYGVGIEFEDLPEFFDSIPKFRERTIRADSARPETISYVSRKGFPIEAVNKWPGSVEDGIEWLRSFRKIVIHPSCTHTIVEARRYSYKVDRLTGEITTDIVDAYNHIWDAVRYACEPMIASGNLGILSVL